ncbi:MAG: JAB domain-containing protein [Pseudomonadota bacterium]|nr:DNA repair protein [Gammaproteobacteria bacterium]MBU1629026.1 DNA repair protein [Gammaproteobacteria bacterium]MBU2546735.1 DNA repair protein [Gammaproteobacteria bacterium]
MTKQNCSTSVVCSEGQLFSQTLPEFVHVVSEQNDIYTFSRSITGQELIECAKHLLNHRMLLGDLLTNVELAKEFCMGQLADMEDELFIVIFLSSQNRVLGFERPFYGTINRAMVYPRTIVKLALQYNASAIVVAHNHPGGKTLFSVEDLELTRQLESLMQSIDIRLLDHILVAGGMAISMKDRGFL